MKLLGFAIIAGAFTFKVPQIKKLVDAQEARGLSFLSTYVETASFGSVVVYHVLMGNPVSAWGENAIIMVQQVVLLALMWKYTSTSTGHMALVGAGIVGLFAFELSLPKEHWCVPHPHPACARVSRAYAVCTTRRRLVVHRPLTPHTCVRAPRLRGPTGHRHYIFAATIPAFSAARIPQIYENFKNGHTGLLALITVFMGFAGSVARVFTSLEEVTDMQVAVSFVLGAVWNTILLLQIFWYWNRTNEVMAKKAQ